MNREEQECKTNGNFSIKLVQNFEEFEKLKDKWNSLAGDYGSYTPWLRWDWFNLCTKHFLKDNKFLILVAYKADTIVAIAPFVVKNEKFRGIIQTKKIELFGNAHSPIRNFILGDLSKEDKTSIIIAIFRFLRNEYRKWDIAELDRIPEEKNAFGIFEHVLSDVRLKFRPYFSAANWYLDGIDYSFSQYFENLPKKIQKDVQYCQRRLEKMGNLQFQMKLDADCLDHYLDLYNEVRQRSWKAPEKDSPFLREFTKLAATRGWIRLGFLLFDDVPISCQKWIVCNKIAYIWDVLYDENYAKYSPGKILSCEISKHIFDHDNVIEIDFMTGDEPYKKDWAPKRRERRGLTIFNSSFKGQFLAYLMTRALPVLERNQYLLSAKNKILKYVKTPNL